MDCAGSSYEAPSFGPMSMFILTHTSKFTLTPVYIFRRFFFIHFHSSRFIQPTTAVDPHSNPSFIFPRLSSLFPGLLPLPAAGRARLRTRRHPSRTPRGPCASPCCLQPERRWPRGLPPLPPASRLHGLAAPSRPTRRQLCSFPVPVSEKKVKMVVRYFQNVDLILF